MNWSRLKYQEPRNNSTAIAIATDNQWITRFGGKRHLSCFPAAGLITMDLYRLKFGGDMSPAIWLIIYSRGKLSFCASNLMVVAWEDVLLFQQQKTTPTVEFFEISNGAICSCVTLPFKASGGHGDGTAARDNRVMATILKLLIVFLFMSFKVYRCHWGRDF